MCEEQTNLWSGGAIAFMTFVLLIAVIWLWSIWEGRAKRKERAKIEQEIQAIGGKLKIGDQFRVTLKGGQKLEAVTFIGELKEQTETIWYGMIVFKNQHNKKIIVRANRVQSLEEI